MFLVIAKSIKSFYFGSVMLVKLVAGFYDCIIKLLFFWSHEIPSVCDELLA